MKPKPDPVVRDIDAVAVEPDSAAGERKKAQISLRARAMRYLARREYSRAELRDRLISYQQTGEDLDAVLDELAGRNWLSDARAAEQLVTQKRRRFGTKRIEYELRQRGISEALISQAVPELKAGELETAREVWRRKFPVPPQDAKEKARQIRFLQSRGFSLDVIFKLMKSSPDEEFSGEL